MKGQVLSMTLKKILCAAALSASVFASASFAAPRFSIGLVQLVEHPSLDEVRFAILDELKANGFGPDVVSIDYQNGQNSPSVINTICQKFVSDGVSLILPIATPAAQCAAAATDSIPIVFAAVSDPVAAGLVKDLEHPDRNVTGLSNAIQPAKVLDLAEELTPGIKNYGMVYNAGEVNSVSTVKKAQAEMKKRGFAFREAVITSSGEVATAVNSLIGKVDGFFISNDNTVALAMTLLSEIAVEHKLPVYAAVDSLVADGALATAGINYTQLGRQAAQMVIRVLKGAPSADTPVEVLAKTSVVVNWHTAAALGVDVSKYLKK